MPDDGILGDIGETIGEAAGAVAGELKKFGKSATSQVTGPDKTKTPKSPPAEPTSAKGELKKLGSTIFGQVTGHDQGAQVAQMAKADKEFSKKESDLIAQKIKQIYAAHAARRAQEQKQKEAIEVQKEQQQVIFQEQAKKQEDLSANPAIAKTRAEIKNYGAE